VSVPPLIKGGEEGFDHKAMWVDLFMVTKKTYILALGLIISLFILSAYGIATIGLSYNFNGKRKWSLAPIPPSA
jgi:hypothetical protein